MSRTMIKFCNLCRCTVCSRTLFFMVINKVGFLDVVSLVDPNSYLMSSDSSKIRHTQLIHEMIFLFARMDYRDSQTDRLPAKQSSEAFGRRFHIQPERELDLPWSGCSVCLWACSWPSGLCWLPASCSAAGRRSLCPRWISGQQSKPVWRCNRKSGVSIG